MHMDPPELVDALMEPMMMVVGTMVALSGAYMAIVIDELAARYFRDRDFVCLCECVCGFVFFQIISYVTFCFYLDHRFSMYFLFCLGYIAIIFLYYLHYSNALALAAAGLGGKKRKK